MSDWEDERCAPVERMEQVFPKTLPIAVRPLAVALSRTTAMDEVRAGYVLYVANDLLGELERSGYKVVPA